jgi:hypothetical protein
MRMKTHMASHVDEHRQTMFHESTEEVKKHLTHMCRQVEEQMSNKADEVFVLMRRDYMTAITGAHMPLGKETPKWERTMKAEIAKILEDMEKAVVGDELEVKPKPETEDQESAQHPVQFTGPSDRGEPQFGEGSNSPMSQYDTEAFIQDALNREIKEEYL